MNLTVFRAEPPNPSQPINDLLIPDGGRVRVRVGIRVSVCVSFILGTYEAALWSTFAVVDV